MSSDSPVDPGDYDPFLDDQFILVPVPRSMVRKVYAEIGGGSEAEATEVEDDLDEDWSDDEVVIAYNDSTSKQKAFLKMLTTTLESGQAAKLGLTAGKFAGMMGGFTTRFRSRYGKAEPFFEREYVDGTAHYRVDAATAALIATL